MNRKRSDALTSAYSARCTLAPRTLLDAFADAKPVEVDRSISFNDLPAILTADELADFLGLNRKTVYEQLARGEIPGARRIGHSFRISRDAIKIWLDSGRGGLRSRSKK